MTAASALQHLEATATICKRFHLLSLREKMMAKPKILVTSAAGHTGAPAVKELLKLGFPVRALVRRRDSRSEALRQAGAEIFVGDLFDFRDLRRAMKGVQRAYHCPPFAPNALSGTMLFALAAEEARLEAVTLMTAWNPHATHPSPFTREMWITQNVARWMPTVGVIHLNPGLFAFPYFLGVQSIKHFGMLLLPFGDGLNAPPSNEDVARVAAFSIADPADRIGKRYRPTGPELLSPHGCAEVMGRVLGRRVRYRDISTGMFSKAARAQGFPIWQIAQMRHYAEELRHGAYAVGAPTDHVEVVSGRPAESFETTAGRYLTHPELVWPEGKSGNKFSAAMLMMKTMMTKTPDLNAWEDRQDVATLTEPQLAHQSDEWFATARRQDLNLLAVSNHSVPTSSLAG